MLKCLSPLSLLSSPKCAEAAIQRGQPSHILCLSPSHSFCLPLSIIWETKVLTSYSLFHSIYFCLIFAHSPRPHLLYHSLTRSLKHYLSILLPLSLSFSFSFYLSIAITASYTLFLSFILLLFLSRTLSHSLFLSTSSSIPKWSTSLKVVQSIYLT